MHLTIKRLGVLAIVLTTLSWVAGQWWARQTDAGLRRALLCQTVDVARTLDPALVKQLSFTAADANTPAFEYLRRQMVAFSRYLPQGGIYTMGLRDENLVFGPESYHPDDPMASPPGTFYQEPSGEDLAIFATHQPITVGPMTDEYGTVVSALAPLVDPETDEMLMAVGVDVPADDWQGRLNDARRNAASTVFFGGLALFAIISILRSRWRNVAPTPSDSTGARPDGLIRDLAVPEPGRYACTGLLLGMALLGVAFLGVVLLQGWHWTHKHIDRSASQQAQLAVHFDHALRDYVGKHIRPEMEKRAGTGEFIPETMSTSFISRSVFDEVRKAFPDAILRFASTHPRNPSNRAMPTEEKLIRYFEQHPEVDTWSGTMPFFDHGQEYSVYAIARRFESSCLQCHGRPQDAPAALVARYGALAGFGRSVGQVSLDLAAIPVSVSYAQARTRVWWHMLAAFGLCVLFVCGIGALIRIDLVRRRRTEASLRASEQRLASILQGSPIPTFLIDKTHRVIHWNRAVEQLSGIAAEEILGTTEHWRAFYATKRPCMADLLVDGDFDAIPQWYHGDVHASDLIPEAYEATGFFAETGEGGRWLHLTAAIVRDDQGRLIGAVETLEDITERKRAEEKLQQRESFIQAILDNIPIGIAVNSVDPGVRFEYMNDNFARIYRTTREALTDPNVSFWEAVYQDSDFRAEIRSRVLTDCASSDPDRMHWDNIPITREGQPIAFISAKNTLMPGTPLMISIVWDVTQAWIARQERERLLQQVAAINEELTHFAYVVSHDLKAPLRGIKMLAEWLYTDYAAQFDGEARENLELLQNRVERMHSLIEGVLQYSRVGRIKEDLVDVDLQALLPDIIDAIAPPEHISIRVEGPLPTVACEKTRITQVFQNLLTNAVKYMDKPDGEIVVACTQDEEGWTFSVSDNGPGIEEKYFDKIFKIFQTLAPRDAFESTGVGLTLVKKIVEHYGGRVWLTSEVGTGTTFFFTLPKDTLRICDEKLQISAVD